MHHRKYAGTPVRTMSIPIPEVVGARKTRSTVSNAASNIETIGKPDPFRFRVTTSRETYIVELKEQLPGAAYEVAWSKVYKLEGR